MLKETFKLKGSNDKEIIGDITFSKEKTKNTVIFIHGFKGFKDWGAHNLVANHFAENNINYVKFNFSHSGVIASNLNDVTDLELFANNTPLKELYDTDIVINYIAQRFPSHNISLIGHSRGGGISIIQAQKDTRINKLITWAAINDFSSLWKKEQEEEWIKNGKIETFNARTKEYMPLNLVLLEDFKNNKTFLDINTAAKNLKKPWLIIHGNNDINVKLEIAKNFKSQNANANFLEIENADHVFNVSHPYLIETLPSALLKVVNSSISFINQQ